MKALNKKQKRYWLFALTLAVSAIAALLYYKSKSKNKSNSFKI